MESSESYFDYSGNKIAWTETGDGKPLLMLHGWGSSSRVMAPVAEHLSHLRKSYLIDLPGFGLSPEPARAMSIDDYADVIEAFIEAHIDEKADLLVHSFGGRITLKLLTREQVSKKIDKVLITGGAGMKPKRPISFYLKKYTAIILKAPFSILPARARERSLGWLRTTAVWNMLGSDDYRKLSGVMRETFVRSVTEHLDPLLPAIDHEVLLLWGEKDEATPLYQAERMDKGLKRSELIVMDGAGHYAFLDKPKQFAAIAEAYLDG